MSRAEVSPATDLERLTPANARWNVLDGVGWHVALASFSITAILPAYVSHLGGGPIASAAVVAVWVLGTRLPQAISSWWCHTHTETRKALLALAAIQRLALFGIFLTALAARAGSRASLLAFFSLYLAWSVSTGLCFPIWVELIARALHPSVSGRALGVRTALSNVAGVAASLGAVALLGRFTFPHNFAAVFALGVVALLLGFWPLALLREVPRRDPGARESFRSYLRTCLEWVTASRPRLRLALGLALSAGIWAPLGLLLPHSLESFGNALRPSERDALPGIYTFVQTLALAALAWPAGRAADRFGSRAIVVAGMLTGAAAPLLALSARGVLGTSLAYAAVGATFATFNTGVMKLYMEESQGKARSGAIVALEAVEGTAMVLTTLAAGVAAARWGYSPVFVASAVVTLAGAAVISGYRRS